MLPPWPSAHLVSLLGHWSLPLCPLCMFLPIIPSWTTGIPGPDLFPSSRFVCGPHTRYMLLNPERVSPVRCSLLSSRLIYLLMKFSMWRFHGHFNWNILQTKLSVSPTNPLPSTCQQMAPQFWLLKTTFWRQSCLSMLHSTSNQLDYLVSSILIFLKLTSPFFYCHHFGESHLYLLLA